MDEEKTARPVDKHIDNALKAINEKKPVPEIDFTLHTMEDGSTVSTMERVCKGNCSFCLPLDITSAAEFAG